MSVAKIGSTPDGALAALTLTLVLSLVPTARAESISVVIPADAAPRVEFGAEQLAAALKGIGSTASIVHTVNGGVESTSIVVGSVHARASADLIRALSKDEVARVARREAFAILSRGPGRLLVAGGDDSGVLYGCLDLAKRIRGEGKLPSLEYYSGTPSMTLRGTCVAMQKTYILPGRKVYEYPYTPESFPWFYDKELWRQYLDFLAANRMNTLYLWNGHPFASLVKLKDYPEAVEVPPDVLEKNVETFRWLATECDKRGIWLVQMFYNILLPKPLAEKYGVSTQLAAPTPLASDYTRKAIAEFVKQYPNVGLMVCLGEALQGTENQVDWATNTILPGVLDGMKAAGLKEQPPVVIRTHAMDPEAIMPACFKVYSNLYTETKYNGESLTTYEPRGKAAQTHRDMARLGPHLVNVHILANLEPFRYGATEFIRKSVLASRDRFGASGLHLYPLAYWNWPYSPDLTDPPLKQWDRDWIWFEAWARYSWNPDVPEAEDRTYWLARLADFYGNRRAAENVYDAYNNAGEVAPRLIRRFGITEGNRQTLSLGMTLDQLVNPRRYRAYEELWLSQAPPGERLDEFARKEWNHQPHVGETPESIIADVLAESGNAVASADAAEGLVTRNRDEFERLRNDMRCIRAMAQTYAAKARAAELVLRYNYSHDISDMERAEAFLAESLAAYKRLDDLTAKTYQYANSMQTSQRKIPVSGGSGGKPANYRWSQLLPVYEKELADFRGKVAQLKLGTKPSPPVEEARNQPWPPAQFKVLSTFAETYRVEPGAKTFTDRGDTIQRVARQLTGLTGIRFSHTRAKDGLPPIEFSADEPVYVLVGYFESKDKAWLQVPRLETVAQADERGGVDTVLESAATIENCPGVNVHAFRFDAGRQSLELIGKGSFVILGVVPQSVTLK